MTQLTHGSLFAGIGGFDLGFERAGIKTVWQVEIDPFCRRVLERHFPEARRFADIRECFDLPEVDVLTGGFPCQPVSLAGQRRAQADERWLWPEYERIIRLLRPDFVVVENVPGLFTAGFGDVLGGLAACGYDAEWSVLSACRMVAPHARERVFLVAYPEGGRFGQCGRIKQPQNFDAARDIHYWRDQPEPVRMADGIPNRMDRLRGLGNAVVPQIAEWIGRRIVACEAARYQKREGA